MPRKKGSLNQSAVCKKIEEVKKKQQKLQEDLDKLMEKRQYELGCVVAKCGLLNYSDKEVKEIIMTGLELFEPEQEKNDPNLVVSEDSSSSELSDDIVEDKSVN
jgi:hypothetical protein